MDIPSIDGHVNSSQPVVPMDIDGRHAISCMCHGHVVDVGRLNVSMVIMRAN